MIQLNKMDVTIRFLVAGIILLLLTACTKQQSSDSAGTAPNGEPGAAAVLPFSENSIVFDIIPEESEARFLIDEVLRGEDKTVVGRSQAVSGQIAVDFDNPPASTVGPVLVNALTLETDNAFRNRAVHNRILLASIYEFVTFNATDIRGLPDTLIIGEPIDFQIEGDFTITAYTQPVIFEVTAVPISESRFEGQASAVIKRVDFDLVVPNATGVAEVGNEVILELDFVAGAASE